MAQTLDLSANPNILRLQSLQKEQTKEMTKFRVLMTKSIAKLSSQISSLGSNTKEGTIPPDPSKTPREFGDQSYLLWWT